MLKLIKQSKVQILIIVVLTILAYLNIFQNEFVIDDKTFFVDWNTLHSLENIPKLFTSEGLPANSPHIGYRPIRMIIMAILYQLFGQSPLGYHFFSILVHLINTLLIYLIIKYITKKKISSFGCQFTVWSSSYSYRSYYFYNG